MHRRSTEAGYTLSEVCIAVVVLAVAIVAAVGALSSAIFVSHQHRDVVTSDTLVRRYAEQLTAATYQDCWTGAQYLAANPPVVPTGFAVTITSVEYGNTGTPLTFGTSCSTDHGTQLIKVRAQRSNGSGTQTVQIVKRKP